MPLLTNPKHERFAQELAKGLSASAAYVAAGYAKSDSNASRLSSNEKVRTRVQELLQEGAEKAGVTIQRIVDELAKIAFHDAADYFEWGPSGVIVKSSADLTPEQRAAVTGAQQTISKTGENVIKVTLSDKQAALEKLGRHLGMFKPDGGQIGNVQVIITSADAEL